MGIFELNSKTKDGRKWVYKVYYLDLQGNRKQYMSKKYLTKKEAQENERLFLMNIKGIESKHMTFGELYVDFCNFQKDKVKSSVIALYNKKWAKLTSLDKVKLKDFNLTHFNKLKMELDQPNLSSIYKNSFIKFIRQMLNYASQYHNYNFGALIKKMSGFNDPNEIKKEMEFWDYEEFQKFIAVEDKLIYKTFYETLYYCGLRLGEAKALNWNDINFINKTIDINKSLTSKIKGERYVFGPPKTRSSIKSCANA